MSKHLYVLKETKPEINGLLYLPIMKIITYFNRNRKIVVLSTTKERYITITYAKKCVKCDKVHAPVYPYTKVGDVVLEENGKISNDSEAFYIDSWEYYNKKEKQQWK